jgi:hypothetical protein
MLKFDHPLGIWQTFSEDWRFLLGILLAGTVTFFAISLAWQVNFGVDTRSYLAHYFDLNSTAMQLRTYLVSDIIGLVSELPYKIFYSVVILCYLLAILWVYYVARLFGIIAARVVTILLLLHFDLTILFHFFASDNLYALAMVLWTALLVRLHRTTIIPAFVLLGIATFGLVLIRPPGAIFILMAAFPVVMFGFSRLNIRNAIIFVVTFVTCYAAYSYNNYRNYGNFHIVSNSQEFIPGLHVFKNGFFRPENGPNSKELFRLVQEELINRPMYQQQNMDVDQFFINGGFRRWTDLLFVDRVLSPGIISRASYEAIGHNPVAYATSIAKKTYSLISRPFKLALPKPKEPAAASQSKSNLNLKKAKKEFIPYSSTPEGAKLIAEFHGKNVANIRDDQAERDVKIMAEIENRLNVFSSAPGNYHAAYFTVTTLSTIMPPQTFFLIITLFSLPLFRRPEMRLLWMMLVPAMIAITVSAMIRDDWTRYRLPFDFIFMLIGTVGLMGNKTVCGWFSLDKGHEIGDDNLTE